MRVLQGIVRDLGYGGGAGRPGHAGWKGAPAGVRRNRTRGRGEGGGTATVDSGSL